MDVTQMVVTGWEAQWRKLYKKKPWFTKSDTITWLQYWYVVHNCGGFPQSNLTMGKRVFNYKSSRSRQISENAFGILANRWRIFRRPFALEPEKVKIITLSALIMHNWLQSVLSSGKIYIPQSLVNSEDTSHEMLAGNWRSDVPTESWFDLTPTPQQTL